MSLVTEFAGGETCTAVIHVCANGDGGEAYQGPISIGFYNCDAGEVWIECEGARINVPAHHFATFIKQMKRANILAKATKEQP